MSRKQIIIGGVGDEAGRRADRGGGGAADDSGCPILHVDMDAFYASVELLDRPELKGTPVIVGAPGARGVVLSATYEARRFGVHSAMAMTRARRLCPVATVIPPRHGRYAEVSRGIREIFEAITPLVEPIASDEAFLDVGGARRRLGPPALIARMIREQVAERHGITCSVGVASSKFVAKLASRACKPDGLLVVPADQVVEFLHPLPVGALWGVGERTEQALVRLGIRTVGDLARVPVATLQREFGAVGAHLAELAWGRDDRPVVADAPDKNIGGEETFPHDVDDPETIRRELLRLSERVAARLRAGGHVGRTVSVKLRRSDFTTITRSRTLREATDVAKEIYDTARALYEAAGLERVRLRLVGVRVENLRPAATATRQLSLGERETGWREAELAVDRATRRFGPEAVRPASLVRPPSGAMGP
ncbi:DNA polymerase IV [Sphaerimonospora thailandensis]|uniref:DNA polymerase IV n=1 Tax=Sphaerimonospora thailandensis TaxID=795644 RepID=A0A8J3R5I1_9ACTN|nr:DNA polymerase IV [Sphaerimonospora thailandensis]